LLAFAKDTSLRRKRRDSDDDFEGYFDIDKDNNEIVDDNETS